MGRSKLESLISDLMGDEDFMREFNFLGSSREVDRQNAIADSQGGIVEVDGMATPVKSVCFSCTGCGVCCDTPPSLRIEEIAAQSTHFVLGAELRSAGNVDLSHEADIEMMEKCYPELPLVERIGTDKRLAKRINETNSASGVPIAKTVTQSSSAVMLFGLVDVDQMSGACPQRAESGKCKIYENRPMKCRLVPFDETIPEQDAGDALAATLGYLRSSGGTCRIDPGAPIIWKDGAFAAPETAQVHRDFAMGAHPQFSDAGKAVINEYLDFKAVETGLPRDQIEAGIEILGTSGTHPVFSLVPALYRLMCDGYAKQETVLKILENQIAMIDARLLTIDPHAPMKGAEGAPMKKILEDWRDLYASMLSRWSS